MLKLFSTLTIFLMVSLIGYSEFRYNYSVSETFTSSKSFSYVDLSQFIPENANVKNSTDKWQTLFENDTLRISESTRICLRHDREQRIKVLRFENKLSTPLTFNFERYIYREGECTTCKNQNQQEYTFKVSLDANQVLEGDCETLDNRTLYVFDKFVKIVPGMSNSTVSDIEFRNFHFID